MLNSLILRWTRCAAPARMAGIAVLLTGVNAWLGVLLATVAVWLQRAQLPTVRRTDSPLWLWWLIPVAMALITLSYGKALPPDDLLRHLVAWQIGLDYRAQYPWATVPQANLWLGFDYSLGQLQQWGLPANVLLQWLPGLGLVLTAAVLYGALRRAVPRHRRQPDLFLVVGALGLMLISPRMLLGRPEAFLAVLGGAAWLCRRRGHAALWIAGYLLATPCYWLGWVYAPFALLLPFRGFGRKLALVAGLMAVHLTFWQMYTGDYLGLMIWLRGTLSVAASENGPMLQTLAAWPSWVFFLLVGWGLSLPLRPGSSRRLFRGHETTHLLPVALLLVWFALPNQIRYQPAMAFALLPWLLRSLVSVRAARRESSAPLPQVLVLSALIATGMHQVPQTEDPPRFHMGAHARVFSEQPYATVFYGAPGIAVEPSFALGATKSEWTGLMQRGVFDCPLAQRAGFTHLVEKSLVQMPTCAVLQEVQGIWRLWRIRSL